jgi:hypothetical protein
VLDDVHVGVDLQENYQALLSPLLQTKNMSSFTQMNIMKENGYKVEVGEDEKMEDLSENLSINNMDLDYDKTIPNGNSRCPLPSGLSFQLSLIDEKDTSSEVFLEVNDLVSIPRNCG